jgi:hypothetical protein
VDWGWLVPIIILLIWIINHVLRGNEEERPTNRNRPAGNQRQAEGRPTRRPTTEIDRFLEEVNRRRRQASERREPPVVREIPAASAQPVARPPRAATTRPPAPPRVVRPAPERVPERPPVVEAVVVEAVAAPPAPRQLEPSPQVLMPGSTVSAPSAAMERLTALLESSESLRTAIILHEIFGPPRCQRHRLL